jgi:RNA polymerase sigma-70 factor (ECF subfamily)
MTTDEKDRLPDYSPESDLSEYAGKKGSSGTPHPTDSIEGIYRHHAARVLANLIGQFGDFELAEDALQEALVVALTKWPRSGVPPNPAGWLTLTARRKAIDHLRRNENFKEKINVLGNAFETQGSEFREDTFPDERLKLVFMCCHRALSQEAQMALTLKALGGLTTSEIASAFLVPLPTMAQRLVRAKMKIRDARIPFLIPESGQLAARVATVLSVLYLIFNEGYMASQGETLFRTDLSEEAIRLSRALLEILEKEGLVEFLPETLGLLALMLLHDSRKIARISPNGELVLLEDQNRGLWIRESIDEGIALLKKALGARRPGPYQAQAAISAVHAEAKHPLDTDWQQIIELYTTLETMQPTPVIKMNRAIAIAMAGDLTFGLRLLDELDREGNLSQYVPFHSAKADLFRRQGNREKSLFAYRQALDLSQNEVEQSYFLRRITELEGDLPDDR